MSNSIEALQKAIEVIKTEEARGGRSITELDMAHKMDLSDGQLRAYLREGGEMPDGFVTALYAAYGMTVKKVEFKSRIVIRIPTRPYPPRRQGE